MVKHSSYFQPLNKTTHITFSVFLYHFNGFFSFFACGEDGEDWGVLVLQDMCHNHQKRPVQKAWEIHEHVGVSKNRDTRKWMVRMEHPIKMDNLGVPLFLETPMYFEMLLGFLFFC